MFKAPHLLICWAQRGREGERERGGNGEVERGRKRGRREKGRCKEGGAKRRADHTNTSAFHAHLHTCTDTGPKASADSVSCLSLSLSRSLAHTLRVELASSHSSPMKETRACARPRYSRAYPTPHTYTHQQCTTQTASVKGITRYEEVCGRKRDELVPAADEAARERGLRETSQEPRVSST